MRSGFAHSRLSRFSALAGLVFALAACSQPAPPLPPAPKKHTHYVKQPEAPIYNSNDYIQHLSLAALTLTQENPSLDAAQGYLDVLQCYTTPKPEKPMRKGKKKQPDIAPDSVTARVVIMQCKGTDGSLHLGAPLDGSEQPDVAQLASYLLERGCVLDNIMPASVTVNRGAPLNFKNMSANEALQQIQMRLQPLLSTAQRLPPLDEARTDIQLVRIFKNVKERDAAYLAAENAKHALAEAEKNAADAPEAERLLGELDKEEADLQRELPFHF